MRSHTLKRCDLCASTLFRSPVQFPRVQTGGILYQQVNKQARKQQQTPQSHHHMQYGQHTHTANRRKPARSRAESARVCALTSPAPSAACPLSTLSRNLNLPLCATFICSVMFSEGKGLASGIALLACPRQAAHVAAVCSVCYWHRCVTATAAYRQGHCCRSEGGCSGGGVSLASGVESLREGLGVVTSLACGLEWPKYSWRRCASFYS